MMSDLLRITGVSVRYGGAVALRGVSLEISPGEIVAILGANGAGKTTLLNAISGIVPCSGEIWFDGRRIDGLQPWVLARMGIAHVPEGREIFPGFTVDANLRIAAHDGGGPHVSVNDVLEMFPRLRKRRAQYAGNLSGGEQQMLAIGRALLSRPRLVLFDEPSLSLSPMLSKFVLRTIAGLRERGITSLLVEQNVRASLKIADRAYLLRNGEIVRSGTAAALSEASDIREAYLGV
jgi:branched-chain amino acid transport system ATP-binding protein